jgi:hypothetical protein
MNTLIVGEVSTILYALGIPKKKIHKIILINICPELRRAGVRPFAESLKLARLISSILGIEFESYETNDAELVSKLITSKTIVDTSIISYFRINKAERKGCAILSASIEHSFVNSPSIFSGLGPGLKKRIDLNRKIFIPLKIFKLHSMGGPNKIFSPIRLKSINFDSFYERSMHLLPQILDALDGGTGTFTQNLGDPRADKTLFVLPRPKEIGGSNTLNMKIISDSIIYSTTYGFDQIVVKNHPMDDFDYSKLDPKIVSTIPIVYLSKASERMFPLELLVHYFNDFNLYGCFSTVFHTLNEFLCEIPHIYLPTNFPLEIYAVSSILPYVPHIPHYLPWDLNVQD